MPSISSKSDYIESCICRTSLLTLNCIKLLRGGSSAIVVTSEASSCLQVSDRKNFMFLYVIAYETIVFTNWVKSFFSLSESRCNATWQIWDKVEKVCAELKLMKNQGKMKSLTGLIDGGDRICNNRETESSTKDFVDKCREIYGDIPLCHERNMSTLSARTVRCLWNGN